MQFYSLDDSSLSNSNNKITPYTNLANAIIVKAVYDYRKALKNKDASVICELEHFFRSQYYSILTNLNGEFLIDSIRKEFQ